MNGDEYIEKIQKGGDAISQSLSEATRETKENSQFAKALSLGMHGKVVLYLPEQYDCVVHSSSGKDYPILEDHVKSAIETLIEQAESLNFKPHAIANVIDAQTSDPKIAERIKRTMIDVCNEYKLVVMNGETAILGDKLNVDANFSATMLSLDNAEGLQKPVVFSNNGVIYTKFSHKGLAVYMNSDGEGTKSEFSVRRGMIELSLPNFAAMDADDAEKLGAILMVLSGVMEVNGELGLGNHNRIREYLKHFYWKYNIPMTLQTETMPNRLNPHAFGKFAFNISGSAVSLIPEKYIKHPPAPEEGDYLVGLAGKRPSSRSNGATDNRRGALILLGEEYENTERGKYFLEYLSEPSTLFYPFFKEGLDSGIATSVFHMSGGSFDGKLAKPLAEQGLYVELGNLIPPDPRQIEIQKILGTTTNNAYKKWPMGPEGFISGKNLQDILSLAGEFGLVARENGVLVKHPEGKTGVEFVAYDDTKVSYSGK